MFHRSLVSQKGIFRDAISPKSHAIIQHIARGFQKDSRRQTTSRPSDSDTPCRNRPSLSGRIFINDGSPVRRFQSKYGLSPHLQPPLPSPSRSSPSTQFDRPEFHPESARTIRLTSRRQAARQSDRRSESGFRFPNWHLSATAGLDE